MMPHSGSDSTYPTVQISGTTSENVVSVINGSHQRSFANSPSLSTPMGDDNNRQATIFQCGALGSAAAFVQFYLFGNPICGARNVLAHELCSLPMSIEWS